MELFDRIIFRKIRRKSRNEHTCTLLTAKFRSFRMIFDEKYIVRVQSLVSKVSWKKQFSTDLQWFYWVSLSRFGNPLLNLELPKIEVLACGGIRSNSSVSDEFDECLEKSESKYRSACVTWQLQIEKMDLITYALKFAEIPWRSVTWEFLFAYSQVSLHQSSVLWRTSNGQRSERAQRVRGITNHPES